jgi:hypothetical protein
VTAFRITYEGPASQAVRAATLLADADGVELTSSQPPQHAPGSNDVVVLPLTVEGTSDAVLDAVGQLREALGPGARIEIAEGRAGRS